MADLSFYQKTGSWYEVLNPITKLYFLGTMIVIPFLITNYFVLIGFLIGVSLLAFSARTFKSYISILLKLILPLLVLLFLMHSLLYPGGETILFSWRFIEVNLEGIEFASLIGLRLLLLVGSILVFLLSTHPKNLVLALEEKGMPSFLGYIILSTMQIIPQMENMSKKILDSQKSRGLEVEGGLITRIKAYIPVIGPLILNSIAQTEQKALALEARAFNAPTKKTTMVDFTLSKEDKIFRTIAILILLGVITGRVVSIWL